MIGKFHGRLILLDRCKGQKYAWKICLRIQCTCITVNVCGPLFTLYMYMQVPNLCWRDVVPEMDYEGFHLSSPDGLSIIMTAYTAGSKDPFPIDMIYGPWVHTSGQVMMLVK